MARSRKIRLLIYSFLAMLALGVLGLGTILGAYLYYAPSLPDVETLRDVQLQVPLRVYTRDGRLIAEYGEQRRVPLRLEEIPEHLRNAIIAAEDDRFYQHPGIDVFGMARAAINNLKAGRIVGGGSTITQQVAKNFFLTFDQVWSRKIREIFLSLKIERELTKDQILELYLNKIFLGNRAYGVGAAAEIYYGKPLSELTLAQQAMIATLPKAPSRYNPLVNPERALERRAYVLGRMLELGYITREEYEEANAAPITAKYHGSVSEVSAPYVGEMVRAEVVQRFGEAAAYNAGYKVITTLDSRLQTAANTSIQSALQEYDRRYGYRGPIRRLDATELQQLLDGDEAGFESAVRELFAAIPAPGMLQPAVVLRADEAGAEIHARDAGPLSLTLDAVSWAAPAGSGRATGPAPKTVSDVLAPGDVIYIHPDAEIGWRLAQIPDVQGALVSLDPQDGAIVSLVGGYDYFLSKFNRATQARRQAGSSFKPFIYSAALANGFTPASIVNDAPVVFADDKLEDVWRPENDSGRFYGPTRLREGLVRSRNLVSIRVLQGIGIGRAIRYISETFGLDRDRLPRDLSLSLGSGSFTPLEMASAYAVIANGGYRIEPYFIDEIIAPNGEIVYKADPLIVCPDCLLAEQEEAPAEAEPTPVALQDGGAEVLPLAEEAEPAPAPRLAPRTQSAQVNYLISDMMRDVVQRGTGVRAMAIGRNDLAGKTGTTNEYRDAWFSGFNPRIVTTVWVGFDDFSTLGSGEYGGRAALPAWIDFMRAALADVPETFPERPPGLVTVRIDPESGLLADTGNPRAIFETFIEGTLPAREVEVRRDDTDDDSDRADEGLF